MEYKGKELQYLKNINSEANSANMMIFGEITNYSNSGGVTVNGDHFASELVYMSMHFKNITININTVGGSIIQGFSIINAMNVARLEGAKITTRIVGIADSMGGMISAFGDKGRRFAASFSSGLVHGPQAQTKEGVMIPIEEMEEGDTKTEALHMKKMLMSLMASSTGKTESQVKKQMDKSDRMTANELKDFGMVDVVEKLSNKTIDVKNKTAVELMVACSKLSEIKINKMELVNKTLGLNVDAAEQSAVTAIQAIQNKATADVEAKQSIIDSKEEEITSLKNKVSTMEVKEVEATKVAATSLVEGYINQGVFKVESKDGLIEEAIKNPESFKNMVSAMSPNSAFVDITQGMSNKGNQVPESDAMTYARMRKFDSEGLFNMEKKNPVKYAKLEQAYLNGNIDIDSIEE